MCKIGAIEVEILKEVALHLKKLRELEKRAMMNKLHLAFSTLSDGSAVEAELSHVHVIAAI